jgi:hypothetical protein
MVDSKKSVTE